ncbi:AAA family ATPase [Halobacterium sp. KA-4]|uniref:ATP-binding protein n=1 Tax=Halobacterium sp. KA-4 TaxID=2896367 RepID=UPI001E3DE08B|nr:AAA family ATPase [Halobacterium sp. KA-4]MCD2200156.1 AAA family ATPase [Halobacterium sp. KA-4]
MRLKTAEIDRYGPLYDCRPPCNDGITVLSGPNEAGKTLYLEALLQLLEHDIADIMDPSPRVSEPPTGRVVVENGGDQYECDGTTSLCDISAIEPSHLQSVFVVRDSDLKLPSYQGYYTSLIEKLGDIHTTEINAIQSELIDRGRLTETRLNISSDQSYNNAGGVRDSAEDLADDIRDYTLKIDEESLDELDASRLRLKRELRETEEQLATQEEAKTVAEYDRLSDQLETYRVTSSKLTDLEAFDRDTLEDLRELRNDIARDRGTLQDLTSDIQAKETEVEEAVETLEDLETRKTELERRESAVDDVRSAIETYRNRNDDAASAERKLTLTKYATGTGMLAAGGVGIAGAITGSLPVLGFGVLLLVTAIASGVAYNRSNNRLTAVETARESVLQSARDAGFGVESVEEVAPAIESYDSKLSQVQERATRTDQQRENAEQDLENLRSDQSELQSQIDEQESRLEELLEATAVATIDEYEERVETREDLEPDRQAAWQSLVDRFGELDVDNPSEKAAAWEQELESLVADVDEAEIDAEIYDETDLQNLEAEADRLTGEIEDLEARLAEHDRKLDGFDQRARNLTTQPFIDGPLELGTHSKEGLKSLAAELKTVVNQIERDAELSRKALEIFNKVKAQEEQKLEDLFDPDGLASQTFETLTGGRYTGVAYDADSHEIVVESSDGRTLTPDVLSHGTKDQLYFSTRVSLAQQLLGNEPGFLLLDDPFLAADPDRLDQGFKTLQRLANNGWQILYLTAKQEVRDTMVDEYGLEHVKIDSLS